MASFVFPNSPTPNQVVINSDTGVNYKWLVDPGKWVIQTTSQSTVDALALTGGTMLGPIVFSADQPTGTGTTASVLQLVDGTADNSATKAASAASVKTAYDLASGALPTTGGTIIGGNLSVKQSSSGSSDGRLYVKDSTNTSNFTVYPTGSFETKGTLTNTSASSTTFKIRAYGVSDKGIELMSGLASNSLTSLCVFNENGIEATVPFHTKGTGISVQHANGTTMAGLDSSGNITAGGFINMQNSQNVKQFRTYGFGGNVLVFYVGDDANSLTRVVDFEAGGIDISVPVGGGISGNDPLTVGSSVIFSGDNTALTYTGAPSTTFTLNTSTLYNTNTYTNSLFTISASATGQTQGAWLDSLEFRASGIQTISYPAATESNNESKVLRFAAVNSAGSLNTTLDLGFSEVTLYKTLYLYSNEGGALGGKITVPNGSPFTFGDQVNDFMVLSAGQLTLNSPAIFSGATFTVQRGIAASTNTTNFLIRGFTATAQLETTNILTIKRSPSGDLMQYYGRNDDPAAVATMGDLTANTATGGLTLTTGMTVTNSEVPSTGAIRFKWLDSTQDYGQAYILFQGAGRNDGTRGGEYIFGRDTISSNVDPNKDIWFKLIAPYGSYGTPSTEFVQPVVVPTATNSAHAVNKGHVDTLITSLKSSIHGAVNSSSDFATLKAALLAALA